MKNIKNIIFISIFFLCSIVYAQTTYKVKAGDTLYGISKQYNFSIDQIIRLNPQIIGYSLRLGDTIYLPDFKIFIYKVQPKETIYSLSKRFELSQEILLYLNPEIKHNLLKIGTFLRIPSSDKEIFIKPDHQEILKILPQQSVPSITTHLEDDFIVYSVKKEDTLFSIIYTYKVDLSDLLYHNPDLNSGLKPGMILKIPNNSVYKEVIKQESSKENLNIVILLPLYTNAFKKNNELSQYAIDFYSGAKYAVDLLSTKKTIHVKLFDTENNKSKVKNFLNTYNFSQVHAIIGPFFRSNIEQTAKALQKQKIPIISPFVSSEYLDVYPNIIQADVRDQFLADPIIEEIKRLSLKTRTIYLFSTPKEEVITTYLHDQLLKWCPKIKILSIDRLSKIPIDSPPFISILIGDKPEMGKVFIKSIQRFKPGQIFPLGIGYNSIYYNNLSWLKNYKIVFTMKYHVNKNAQTDRKVLENLGINKKMPNKYKLLGFDVIYDILERLIENKKLLQFMDNKPHRCVASKFQYEKTYGGGYINKGVWTVRFKSSIKSLEDKPSE